MSGSDRARGRRTVRVESADDPRVADYRDLRDAELRERHELFMVEGRLGIRRLLTVSRFRPRSLFLTETALSALSDVLGRLDAGTPIYVGPRAVLSGVAGYDVHRGCLAAAFRGDPLGPGEILASEPRLLVVLERVSNPENVGSVFRNALAFGADAVLLSASCADPLYRKAIRVSMGASLRLPFARTPDWPKALLELRERGFLCAALHTGAGALDFDEAAGALAGCERVALVLGHEGDGVGPAALAACDLALRIPIAAGVDSLNVATASGIALHQLSRGPRRDPRA